MIYIGRIDENKGCPQLFEYFLRFKRDTGSEVKLVLIGNTVLRIPSHPDIRHLGFLPEEDKFDALSGAELLVMPSFYESLSMVTLEAWALGRPVLANAHCDVLQGPVPAVERRPVLRELRRVPRGAEASSLFGPAAGRSGRKRQSLLQRQLHLGHRREQIPRHPERCWERSL